ncbi:MAG: AAA family ATPase [Pyrinomonadaceae bacterium]
MVEILCHRERANSPMLVGEPGVGKTAVVEGLARLIELEPEKVPARLRNSHIVQLQMGGLVAGTMLRGMFEERIKGIIDEVKERDNLILFIDEAHTIIGAGAALGTSSDAANMFKASSLAASCESSAPRQTRNTKSTLRRMKLWLAGSAW